MLWLSHVMQACHVSIIVSHTDQSLHDSVAVQHHTSGFMPIAHAVLVWSTVDAHAKELAKQQQFPSLTLDS